jgi:site-specific DNA-cytosine methylase
MQVSHLHFVVPYGKSQQTISTLLFGISCLTITAGKKTILYDYPRYMSDTEVIKCGSFPRDYNFYGTSVVYSVGMSVPI